MLKKTKLYSLLLIIVASTVVGLIIPSQTAFADQFDATGFDDKRVLDDANIVSYSYVVSWCLQQTSKYGGTDAARNGDNNPTQTDIAGGEWFSSMPSDGEEEDWYKKSVGYAAENNGGDGIISCNDDNVTLGSYITTLGGWSSHIDAACDLSFRLVGEGDEERTPDEIADCKDISSDDKDKEYRAQNIDERGGDENTAAQNIIKAMPRGQLETGGYSYNPIQMYLLYKTALLKSEACGASLQGLVSENTSADSSNYKRINLINMAGEPNEVYINIPDEGKEVTVAYGVTAKCGDLIGLMDDNQSAYVTWLGDSSPQASYHVGLGGSNTIGGGEDSSTCRVDGIGWIVCPVVNLMAGMVDDSYYLLDNSLLRTQAISLETDEPLYQAWELMRNFANVAFVLVFMFIIFSQITSVGISNYGIKQLLPKLIIAAILVNLSYIICAAAVDVSNLLGSELKEFFDNLAGNINAGNSSGPFGWDTADDGSGKAGIVGWGAIAGSILLVGGLSGGALAILALLIPFLFAALGAVIATVITLIIRQALIIILIFIAPLAFVALLLPNTEGYFKSWRKLFQSLLLLYPVIALVFGGSALASVIIMAAAEAANDGAPIGEGLGGVTQTLLQLSGAIVSVLPLFLVPMVIKVAGGALNRFAGIVNNPNKGPIDWARNRSMKGVERMKKDQASNAFERGPRRGFRGKTADFVSGRSKYFKDSRMKSDDANRESELAYQEAGFNATEAVEAGTKEGASAADVRRGARAQSTLDRMDNQAVEDAVTLIKRGQSPETLLKHTANELKKANDSGDSVRAMASAKILSQNGAAGNKMLDNTIQEIIDNGGLHEDVDSDLRTSLIGSKTINNAREQWALGVKDENGNTLYNDIESAYSRKTVDGLTAQELASQKDYVLDKYQDPKHNAISPEAAQNVLNQAAAGDFSLTAANRARFELIASSKSASGTAASSPSPSGGTTPTGSAPASTTNTPPSGGASSPASTPSTAPAPQASPSQPADNGMPTQTESPTFTPSQSGTPSASTPSTISGNRQRDWSGYDSGSGATAEAVEKVARELKDVANKLGENTPTSVSAPPSTPATPQPSAPPTISGSRQRDWSGYNQQNASDSGQTQTESPTYTPNNKGK